MFMPLVKHTLPARSIPLNPFSARISFMETGDRVKQARAFLKMTQEAFGKVAGVSKAAVSQWENGITTPQRDALLNLYRKRNISPEWITSGRGEMLGTEPADAPGALTVDQAEILALWAQLMPAEQTEILDKIRERAAHNEAVRAQFAPPEVTTRTVNVSERRMATIGIPFMDRRKKNAQ